MSIVFCAPLSAILMNTFGPILVDKDPEEEELHPELDGM